MILPFLCCQLPNPLFVVVEQLEYISLCMLSRMGSLHERGMCTRRPLLWQLPKQESGEFSILFSLSPRAVRPTLSRPPWVLPLPPSPLSCPCMHHHSSAHSSPGGGGMQIRDSEKRSNHFRSSAILLQLPTTPFSHTALHAGGMLYSLPPFTTRAKIRNRYGIWHVRRQGKCKKKNHPHPLWTPPIGRKGRCPSRSLRHVPSRHKILPLML